MENDQIRRKLLVQHRALRGLIERTRSTAEEAARGVATAEALRRALEHLRDSLSVHHEEEDALLRPLLPGIDAWGPERLAVMEAEHQAEHTLLMEAVEQAARASEVAERVTAAEEACRKLLEHMAEEERLMLASDVLTDDIIKTAQVAG